MSTLRQEQPHPEPKTRRARRGAVVLAAVLVPVLVWLAADPVLGQDLRITEEGGQRTLEIGLFPIAVVSLLAALAGWGLLAALERFTRRARLIWAVVATAVLLVSFLPLTGPGMTGGTRTALALIHLSVAAVLIPGLAGAGRGASGRYAP